jgi:hypothetical protein
MIRDLDANIEVQNLEFFMGVLYLLHHWERVCVSVCLCVCSTSIVVRAQMVRPSFSPCAHFSHLVPPVPGELAGQQIAECRVSYSTISAGILFLSSNLQSSEMWENLLLDAQI